MKNPIFLLLSGNRTGSTVIRRALNEHPDLVVEDELLCFDDKDGYCRKIREELYLDLYYNPIATTTDVIPFLNYVFEKFNGFKIHRTDDQIDRGNSAWAYLANKPDLKIIHLARKNKVRQYVSLKVAEKAKVWHIEHDEALPKLPQIEIPDVRDMVYTMQGWEKDELYFEMLFQNQQSIKVWYEDLQKDINATFAYIQGFLEVELRHNLPVLNKKMTVQKMEDLVVNYKEIKNKLKGTAWEGYAV